jgi:hypothetical protein
MELDSNGLPLTQNRRTVLPPTSLTLLVNNIYNKNKISNYAIGERLIVQTPSNQLIDVTKEVVKNNPIFSRTPGVYLDDDRLPDDVAERVRRSQAVTIQNLYTRDGATNVVITYDGYVLIRATDIELLSNITKNLTFVREWEARDIATNFYLYQTQARVNNNCSSNNNCVANFVRISMDLNPFRFIGVGENGEAYASDKSKTLQEVAIPGEKIYDAYVNKHGYFFITQSGKLYRQKDLITNLVQISVPNLFLGDQLDKFIKQYNNNTDLTLLETRDKEVLGYGPYLENKNIGHGLTILTPQGVTSVAATDNESGAGSICYIYRTNSTKAKQTGDCIGELYRGKFPHALPIVVLPSNPYKFM